MKRAFKVSFKIEGNTTENGEFANRVKQTKMLIGNYI